MFEKAPELLHTLKMESLENRSPDGDPMRLGTMVFCTILRELPTGESAEFPYPGIFGLEFTTGDVRAEWERRIAAEQDKDCPLSAPPPEFQPLAEAGCRVDDGGRGHTTIDFGDVLQNGLKSIYERVSARRTPFEECACEALLAVKAFAAKFGCRVPWEPARTLDEALQSIWLVYECIIFSELVPWSYSWGRMDRYLLPYIDDVDDATLTETFARFFRFLAAVNFNDDASALNVGGPDGFNRLSRAIISAVAQNRTTAPLLTVRVHDKMPDEDWELFLRPELLACGQPTMYGETACRAALRHRGYPEDVIDRWAVNSCMGLVIPGEEWQDMWGAVVPQTLALELVLNNGRFFRDTAPFETGVAPVELTTYHVLYQQLLKYIQFLFRSSVDAEDKRRADFMEHFQNVFVSLFYKDCIERQKEVRDGGVRIRTMIVETMGLVNLADSLFTIRKLVFEERKYTLGEIAAALKTDFADAPELLSDISRLPKFGENAGGAEAIMKQLANDIAVIAEQFNTDAFICAPSLHTLHSHIGHGGGQLATADGRRAGAPLAKNAGTNPDVHAPHTSLVLSVSCWDQSRFSGGQPLDLWIDAKDWHDKENVRRYAALFRTYFSRGGLQLQINGADPAELRAAMEHPERYGHLIVRIGGFSMRFVDLQRDAQEDFIRRFASGM